MNNQPGQSIDSAELTARADRLKLVLTDCDGVLTDASVYVSERGEELKRFSLRDGMGVELLRNAGIETGLITREATQFPARRAEKLKLPHVYLGVRDKAAELPRVLEETGCRADQIGYIGDDVNDLGIIEEIVAAGGLAAAPGDAVAVVLDAVHLRCSATGGNGAFREFTEWLLAARSITSH